ASLFALVRLCDGPFLQRRPGRRCLQPSHTCDFYERQAAAGCMNSKLVLLVDSDADVRACYRTALEGIGYEVDEAEDGRQALVKVFSRRPSVIVTGTRLAFIDGNELCTVLRRDPD